ncbi:hypothetical protein SO802_009245 [Lithocarpus litseifolius]|uniref:Uncharacterized protein n=1 Tax=Lithocarpus litseifolius TaxID=425828 RepID=A0AAW2DAX7_9ROSI
MKLGLVIEESQGLQTHLNVEDDVMWEMVLPLSVDPSLTVWYFQLNYLLHLTVKQGRDSFILMVPVSNMILYCSSVLNQQKEAVRNSEVLAVEPEGKPQDHFAARGRGLKRKMRGGRGGKYMRTYEGSRKPVETPNQNSKKHQGNLKRFHGHHALYGARLQALYPPNFNAPSEHGQMGLQAAYQPNVNPPSTSLTPQVQPGVNEPRILLA